MKGPVLYVEDEEADVDFMRIAFERAGLEDLLHTVSDGQEAIDYLSGAGRFCDRGAHPLPCLVLLDLNLPAKSGFEVLRWIREQPCFQNLPVVIVSSSAQPIDLQRTEREGAADYIIKPGNPLALREVVERLAERWLKEEIAQGDS